MAWHVMAWHGIALHCIASHRIASHRIASHRIVSYRIVSYRIVLYCIVLYCILNGQLEGKITKGRPRTEWMTNITEWTGMRYEDLVRLAEDREPTFSKKTAPGDDDDTFNGLHFAK